MIILERERLFDIILGGWKKQIYEIILGDLMAILKEIKLEEKVFELMLLGKRVVNV